MVVRLIRSQTVFDSSNTHAGNHPGIQTAPASVGSQRSVFASTLRGVLVRPSMVLVFPPDADSRTPSQSRKPIVAFVRWVESDGNAAVDLPGLMLELDIDHNVVSSESAKRCRHSAAVDGKRENRQHTLLHQKQGTRLDGQEDGLAG
jgi:hypothetical protein